jgi:hypothetical protein
VTGILLISTTLFLMNILQMKFFIYLWWVAGEDAETQRNGVVSLFWPDEIHFPDKREAEEAIRVIMAVPCRIAALHQCLRDGPRFRLMNAVLILSLDVETKTRMKFHTGTDHCHLNQKLLGCCCLFFKCHLTNGPMLLQAGKQKYFIHY